MTEPKSVKNVPQLVSLVLIMPPVSFVLKTESTHQHVNVLKVCTLCKVDLAKIVHTNVLPVPITLITVVFVQETESMLHLVPVLKDIGMISKPLIVSLVLIDV